MAMGDAGDDFSLAAARAVLRGTSSMLRFLLTRTAGRGSFRARDAFDRCRDRVEREIDEAWGAEAGRFVAESDEAIRSGNRVVWAADDEERRAILTACERLNIEAAADKSKRADGIVRIRLSGNWDSPGVAAGADFDPLDAGAPEVAAMLERFTYEAARAQAAFREAASAAREATLRDAEEVVFDPGELDPSVPDAAAAARNATVEFKVTRWDQSGSVFTDALDRMGVGCAVRAFAADGEYIPAVERTDASTGLSFDARGDVIDSRLVGAEADRIQVVFDARQTPLVEKAAQELMDRGVRGLTPDRFPRWEADMRHARRKMADLMRGQGTNVYCMTAPDAAQADALVSAASRCGVAAVAVPPSADGTVRVFVDPPDAIASEAAVEAFAGRLGAAAEGRLTAETDKGQVRGVLADAGLEDFGPRSRPGCRHRPAAGQSVPAPGTARSDLAASYGARARDTPSADRIRAPRLAAEANRALAPAARLAPARKDRPDR